MADVLDQSGRPLPPWMQDHLAQALAQPGPDVAALDKARRQGPLPLALKMCSGCTRQYAAEGDVGDEQGGTIWYGPCCPVPSRYQDVLARQALPRG